MSMEDLARAHELNGKTVRLVHLCEVAPDQEGPEDPPLTELEAALYYAATGRLP